MFRSDSGWFASGGGGSVDSGYTPDYASLGGGGDANMGTSPFRSGDAMQYTGGGGGGAMGWNKTGPMSNTRVCGFGGSGIVIIKTSDYIVPTP